MKHSVTVYSSEMVHLKYIVFLVNGGSLCPFSLMLKFDVVTNL